MMRELVTIEADLESERLKNQLMSNAECPSCGTKLVKDTALSGRYECGAWPCDAFRQPEFVGLPSCDFQCFV